MDYDLLRQKVELIIKGLEYMHDIEAEDDFVKLLDDFALRQMQRCRVKRAELKAQQN